MVVEGCGCDICRNERAREALDIPDSQPGVIICFRDSPGRRGYMRPPLMTEWLLTQGWEWTPCRRMLQEVKD